MDLLLLLGIVVLLLGFGGFVFRLAASLIGGILAVGAVLLVLGLLF